MALPEKFHPQKTFKFPKKEIEILDKMNLIDVAEELILFKEMNTDFK